ncbi:unnamed protein product [Chrysoparadoxa australica]
MLSPQAKRLWKIAQGVVLTTGAYHFVFRYDYGPGPHAFEGIQSWYQDRVDDVLGVDKSSEPRKPRMSTTEAMQQVKDARAARIAERERGGR